MLNILHRYTIFAGLKKCQFYKNENYFLSYIVLAQRVRINNEQIKTIKNWPKLMLIREI